MGSVSLLQYNNDCFYVANVRPLALIILWLIVVLVVIPMYEKHNICVIQVCYDLSGIYFQLSEGPFMFWEYDECVKC